MPMLASIAAGAIKAFGFSRASGVAVVSVLRDAYFKFVTLLLKGNTGTNTDPIYTVSPSFIGDASTNNIQLTINGVAKSDRLTPYLGDGFYSVQMNGTSDYLSVPGTNAGFNFGTNSFTIEGWFWTTTTTQITLFEKRSGATYDWIVFLNATAGYLQIFLTGVVATANATVLFPFGSWVHVALVRNGNVFTLYQNGVSVYTTTNAAAVGYNASYPVLIGADASGPRFWWPGYISNVRIVNGTAVYTAAFTPPTAPLTAIANTVLLTCNNTRLVDKSPLAHVVTATNAPKISQASPFTITASKLLGSGYFNGSTGYVSTPNNTAYQFGTGDFTVEFWWYLTSAFTSIQGPGIGQKAADANNGWVIYRNNANNTDKISIRISSSNSDYATTVIPAVGQWQHWAVTRSGTTLQWYCNGVACGTYTGVTGNASDTSGNMYIGYSQTWAYVTGSSYISDVRVVKGAAQYTGTTTFTPPTAPLSAVAGTSLLTLQYNGSPVNSAFVDNSNSTALVTRGGNATQGTFSPYGTNWSTYFSGSSYVNAATNTVTAMGTGDWTIELWIYPTSYPATAGTIYDTRPAGTGSAAGRNIINISPAGLISYVTTGSIAGGTAPLNTWTHIAVTKQGSSTRLFLNGTQSGSTYTDAVNYAVGANRPIIGTDGNSPLSAGYSFIGHISNIHVIKGQALYTNTFVPSTTPISPTSNTAFLAMNSGSFIDASANRTVLTPVGAPTVSRFSPVSSGTLVPNTGYFSTLFNGLSWMTSPVSALTNIGTQDFTVELWFYMTQAASYGTVFNLGAYNTGIMIRIESTTYSIFIVNTQVYATGTAPLNTWVHLALVRKTGSLYLWANGTQVGTTLANSTSISPTAAIMIGASAHSTTERFFGYVSNLRLVIGNGLYTAAFTPPTAPLTAIAGTAYLALQSDTQVDSSPNNFVIVTSGGTPVIRTFNPFSGNSYSTTYGTALSPGAVSGSAYFDGTGDYITIPNNPLFSNFATTTNFTVEFWFYTNAVNIAQQMLVSHRNTSTGLGGYVPFLIWLANSTVTLYMSNNNSTWNIASAANVGTIYPGTWNHFALCRTNGTIRAFLNGIQTYTLANATVFATVQPLQVGMSTSETNTAFNGYISDVRIVNGVGIYGSGFIPPVVPLTPVKNTSVLFNFNNIGVFDSAGYNDVETAGTARISTSVVKYNSSSIYFGTKTDYLSIRSTPLTATLPGDFTIECWVYPTDTSLTNTWGIIDARASGATAAAWLIGLGAYSAGWLMTIFNGTTYNGTTRIQANEWTHCAWVRVGSTLTFYVNGVAGGTATIAGAITGGTTTVYIGTKDNGLAGYGTVGYIDDLRMTNGYARYTGAFTVPTSLLENGPAT